MSLFAYFPWRLSTPKFAVKRPRADAEGCFNVAAAPAFKVGRHRIVEMRPGPMQPLRAPPVQSIRNPWRLWLHAATLRATIVRLSLLSLRLTSASGRPGNSTAREPSSRPGPLATRSSLAFSFWPHGSAMPASFMQSNFPHVLCRAYVPHTQHLGRSRVTACRLIPSLSISR